jgi:hypothetical protein
MNAQRPLTTQAEQGKGSAKEDKIDNRTRSAFQKDAPSSQLRRFAAALCNKKHRSKIFSLF